VSPFLKYFDYVLLVWVGFADWGIGARTLRAHWTSTSAVGAFRLLPHFFNHLKKFEEGRIGPHELPRLKTQGNTGFQSDRLLD
jgi:hypothetical protein